MAQQPSEKNIESSLLKLFFLGVFFSTVSIPGLTQLLDYSVISRSGGIQPAPFSEPFDVRYQGLRGTPLLYDTWMPGRVFMDSIPVLDPALLNFDLMAGKLLFLDAGQKVYQVDRAFYNHFEIDEKTETRIYIDEPRVNRLLGLEQGCILEILDSKGMLLAQRKKTLVKADFQGPYAPGRVHDEFIRKDEFYLSGPDQELYKKVSFSWSSLKKSMPKSNYEKARKAFKKRNLKLSDETSLIYAVRFAYQEVAN